jgi:hypothetical protein
MEPYSTCAWPSRLKQAATATKKANLTLCIDPNLICSFIR